MKNMKEKISAICKKLRKPDLSTWKQSFRGRSFRAGGYSVASSAVILAIIIMVNLLVSTLPASVTQIDTTSAGLYSLSDQTKSVLAGLEEEVTVYWITRDGYDDATLGMLLERYEAQSGNVKVLRRDPDVYPAFVREYTSQAIDNSLVVSAGGRSRYVDYYEIFEYDYSNYYTTYNYSVNFAGENALTGAISYVVSEDLPKVYLLSGHGEASLPASYTSAMQSENYETEALSLLTAEAVPEDADAILIHVPQTDLSEKETELLRSYLAEGGSLYLITDLPQSGSMDHLASLMADYGVEAEEGIVIESDRDHFAWNMPHYLLADIASHPITNPLREAGYYVMLPIAQGLRLPETAPDGVTVTELLMTTDAAFSKKAGYEMSTFEKEAGDTDGPFALAVAIEAAGSEEKDAQIVWVSCGGIADETANEMVSGGNEDFFMNALGWMCEADENSISIRAKSLSYERISIPASVASLLSLLLVGVIPVTFLIIGVKVVLRRKHR